MTKTITLLGICFALIVLLCNVSALDTPYSLSGHVYDSGSTPLVGVNITFTNMNLSDVIYCDSTSGGEYQQDAANFASGYFDGDIIRYYSVYGVSTNTTNESINVTNGGTLMDIYITLAPTSHLQNNTDYYISYSYTVGTVTQWSNISSSIGTLGESSVNMFGVAILILIVLAAVNVFILPYIRKEN